MSTVDGWTISEACDEFERAGVPVKLSRFRAIVRNLEGLQSIGRKPSPSPKGGHGEALYPIGELQLLHAALAPWLTAREPPPGGG